MRIALLSLACALLTVWQPAASRALAPVADQTAPPERLQANLRVFDKVWDEVRRKYYDPGLNGVDWTAARAEWRPRAAEAADDTALYDALGGMVRLLDDAHARVLSPQAVALREQRRRPAPVVGYRVTRTADGQVFIVRVRPGSPADEAGVRVGWRLLTVDGAPWSPDFAAVEGRPVHLALQDAAGASHEAVLIPRMMEAEPPYRADRSRDGVLILQLASFAPGVGDWVAGQVRDLPPTTPVILDLRDNTGGRVAEANIVLGCFLPRNAHWATRVERSGSRTQIRAFRRCGDRSSSLPNALAVLVNRGSESSAEMVAAAIQEARRGPVIGQRTAGEVLISEETRLPDGGVLVLSRSNYFTAGGVRLEKRGVEPDRAAVRTLEDLRSGRDPVVEAALEFLASSQGSERAPAERAGPT